jgi:hypothetical protein
MRTADRTAAVLTVLIGVLAPRADASGPLSSEPLQQVPAGGPSIDLQNLDDPVGLELRLRRLLRADPSELRLTVPNGQAWRGPLTVAAGQTMTGNLLVVGGRLDLHGVVTGNVVVVDGNLVVHSGGAVNGDAVTIGGSVQNRGGNIQGAMRSLSSGRVSPERQGGILGSALIKAAGLAGVLLTLGLIGFGVVVFARPNLETISDTVSHSFGRSFLAGLLAQILALPTFGMLIAGLVLSVVGILLVPFVIVVVPFLLLVSVIGGFLAVAHAMGETHIRRRMAAGAMVGSPNSYRYLMVGLGAIAAIWLAWVALGWVPFAGTLMFIAAFLATWLLATAGLGACLLSRAGIKPAFAGRYVPPEALTDEYLWATPQFGVSAVKRPEGGKPPRQLP